MQGIDMEYSVLVKDLLAGAPLNELGPGKACADRRAELARLTAESLVAPMAVRDRSAAMACCAGLWLRFDFLEESHGLSQSLETMDGSYWHGLMHRREPDFWNAKYWFRRVRQHAIWKELAHDAAKLAEHYSTGSQLYTAEFLMAQQVWDPFKFVDLCEEAVGSGRPLEKLCCEVQRREWELLFAYDYRLAVGAGS